MKLASPVAIDSVISLHDHLVHWLRNDALPLWDSHGVDRGTGGYFEALFFNPTTRLLENHGDVRRGRVVARQIFSFDVGRRLGWKSMQPDPVAHGCTFLFSRMRRTDGLFHTAVDVKIDQPRLPFSLYENAFYLFVLARISPTFSRDFPVDETAALCLRQLHRNWGKSNKGFEESNPPTMPLKSNPHMHLLEAALAWIEVVDEPRQQPWGKLAEEIVDLCLAHFTDSQTGAIREYFDSSWRPMPDDTGRIVEPGHQFEWAWLLMRWADLPLCDANRRRACYDAAIRLIEIGERNGVDPTRGVAFNELWDDMTPKDLSAKLWPQTERIKAWCALLERARTPMEADRACRNLAASIRGLLRYFVAEPAGLWQEVLPAEGGFTAEPCKASSFYHIACAIETLGKTVNLVLSTRRTEHQTASFLP